MIEVRVALGIVVRPEDGAVLVAQRHAAAHLGGLWEFPGGKCGENEAEEDAVRRELLEETGVAVEIAEAWPRVTHAYADRTVVLCPFLCRPAGGSASALDSQRIAWARVDELDRYPMPAANAPLLERLRAAGTPRLAE